MKSPKFPDLALPPVQKELKPKRACAEREGFSIKLTHGQVARLRPLGIKSRFETYGPLIQKIVDDFIDKLPLPSDSGGTQISSTKVDKDLQ